MQAPEPSFALNASTLAVVGALLGALSGAITFLTRKLIDSKDAEIRDLLTQNETLRVTLRQQAELLRTERDYFRDMAFEILDATRHTGRPDRVGDIAQSKKADPSVRSSRGLAANARPHSSIEDPPDD